MEVTNRESAQFNESLDHIDYSIAGLTAGATKGWVHRGYPNSCGLRRSHS
jgi:hypothetical protein